MHSNQTKQWIPEKVARANFWAFCCYWDYEFFRLKRPFLYHIASGLQEITEGKITSLSISMPPRAGKSFTVSLYCAWMLGKFPDGSIMRNTCTTYLYQKFSYDVRDMIRDERFKRIFPNVVLSTDKQSISGWNTNKAIQVSYFGAGVGGTIIGYGASLVAITDDLYRGHEDALSDTVNDKVHRWHESSHMSRLERNCPRVDVGTRWTKKDIIGSQQYDRVIIVPALTASGKSFSDDVKTTEEYIKLRNLSDPFIWNSEYMQQPIELEGVVFPLDGIKRFDLMNDEGVNVCFVDTADEGNDHFAAVFARMIGKTVYVHDVMFNLQNLTANEEILIERLTKHKVDRCYIETNSAGAYFARNIRQRWTDGVVYGQHNFTNKIGRILAQSGYILENFYFPAQHNDEMSKFIIELCSFLKTGSKHDDAPDCLSGLAFRVRRDFN